MGDPENGGRFTVTEYHAKKTVSEDAWEYVRIELRPLNSDYDPNSGNGNIWSTTGSGKTLTSFKASTLLKDNPNLALAA